MAVHQTTEQSAPAMPPVVMPDLGQIQDSLRNAQSGQGYPQVPPTQPVAEQPPAEPQSGKIPVQIAEHMITEPAQDNDPVSAENQILRQVQEQAAMFTAAQRAVDDQASGQDDQDILEVRQAEEHESASVGAPEAPMPAWSQQEPSQGEAARVDYQKLFDQLRNVQDNQQ